jgi:two-component system nitrogen regulation response regulator NtrX
VRCAAEADSALAEINATPPDLIVLDIWLKDSRMDGIGILKTVRRDNPSIPIVVISGHGNIELAVAAIRQGAYDFIEKPFNTDKLLVSINRGLEASQLRRENRALRQREAPPVTPVGDGAAMRALRTQLERVARSNGRVLLLGPAGAGKEICARFLHDQSARADRPFISLSSASVEPERMEEVLFGREYPDRAHDPGIFEQAHGGTLFLDEVADMPLGTQSKILRVLIDQSFTRLGGSDTVRVDVRLISSTNRVLEDEIAGGRFRQDLFHRLSVVPIEVPGLDLRREDIPQLATHFVRLLNRDQGLPMRQFSADASAALQAMPWPGHVRQLRNLVERLLILGPDFGPIEMEELPRERSDGGTGHAGGDGLDATLVNLPLREAREVFERDYLIAQINRFGGNISKTATFVGMERSALHRKLKSLGVVTTSRGGARMATASDILSADAEEAAAE